MVIPIFFVGVNITKRQGADALNSGELLRLGRGIYIDNVFKLEQYSSLGPQQQLNSLNETISSFAPWIASHITPYATLIASSAYFGQSNKFGRLYIDGVTSGRTSSICEAFFDDNKEHLGNNISKFSSADISLTLERVRTKEAVQESERTSVLLPDSLLSNVELLRYSDSIDSLNNLKNMSAYVTTPQRTLVDVCRWPSDDERSINDVDFVDLCSTAGVSFSPENIANDKAIINEIAALPSATTMVKVELMKRIETLFNPMALKSKEVEEAISLARIQYRINHPKSIFEVFHYERKVANLVDTGNHEWAIRGEGWLMPLDPYDLRMPPIISNLMPEIVKITPPQYLDFFRSSSRFMSNIQIVEFGCHKSPNDYHTTLLTEDDFFRGLISGVPNFSEGNFDFENTNLALHEDIPRVSGMQIKLPMHLESTANGLEMSLARGKSFTHMLKLASNNQQSLIIGEWVGMHISRAIGANTARFQLVDLSSSNGHRLGYVTERFDIDTQESGNEYVSCDLCSVMGWQSEDKYKGSLEIATEIIKLNSVDFESDKFGLLAMIVACLLSDNTDLHMKNISLIKNEATEEGFRLAPVYDMVVTSVIPAYSHGKLALPMNGTNEPNLSDIVTYAQNSLGINPEQTRNYIEIACNQVRGLMDSLIESFEFKHIPMHANALSRCYEAVNKRLMLFQPSMERQREQIAEAERTNAMTVEELMAHHERQEAIGKAEADYENNPPRFSF
ncbi:HipA domain-containing protein (plasmid) [Shewanella xiamenensis]|uniref:HipA domain-containing protein n=1 Tax=Shewanella xiamenensis TaxID=332186 RepID=A0ABT6UFN4_9GAMM|nr:HipA domain-containing protein [Shewanella xiamenensis]MDI5833274.1 HipA domain-containing protein [Shewanella xiamenensis]WHF57976.1 HipA domain-containing protein [Shewanella xiamenensis]